MAPSPSFWNIAIVDAAFLGEEEFVVFINLGKNIVASILYHLLTHINISSIAWSMRHAVLCFRTQSIITSSTTMDIDPADVQILLDFVEGAAQQAREKALATNSDTLTNVGQLRNSTQTDSHCFPVTTRDNEQNEPPNQTPDLLDILEKSLCISVSHENQIPKAPPVIRRCKVSRSLSRKLSKLSKQKDAVDGATSNMISQAATEAKQLRREAKNQKRAQRRLEALAAAMRESVDNNMPDPLPIMVDTVWIRDRETALHRAMQYEQSLHLRLGEKGVFWTDGSKLDNGRAGAAVAYQTLTNEGSYMWMGKAYHFCPCQFLINSDDVELYAIATALEIALSQSDPSTPVVIFSDSQTALTFIRDWRTFDDNSHSLSKMAGIDALKRLASLQAAAVDVRFEWVPGHSGVLGNNIADKMAKYAAETGHGPGGICRTEVTTSIIIDKMMREHGYIHSFPSNQMSREEIKATRERPEVVCKVLLEEDPDSPKTMEVLPISLTQPAGMGNSVPVENTYAEHILDCVHK
jgi:ribonuclease HI